MRRIEGEVGATVLEHDPGRAAHDARPEAHVVRLDEADEHAVGIGRAEVDGAAAARGGRDEALRSLGRESGGELAHVGIGEE